VCAAELMSMGVRDTGDEFADAFQALE